MCLLGGGVWVCVCVSGWVYALYAVVLVYHSLHLSDKAIFDLSQTLNHVLVGGRGMSQCHKLLEFL